MSAVQLGSNENVKMVETVISEPEYSNRQYSPNGGSSSRRRHNRKRDWEKEEDTAMIMDEYGNAGAGDKYIAQIDAK
jgi:hypothetical protein